MARQLLLVSLLLAVHPVQGFTVLPHVATIPSSTLSFHTLPRIHIDVHPNGGSVVRTNNNNNNRISFTTRHATPFNDEPPRKRQSLRKRLRSVRKYVRRTATALFLSASILNARPSPALAAPREKIMSVRPGMDNSQAQAMSMGDDKTLERFEEQTSLQKQTTAPAKSAPTKKQMDDYYDDDEDEEFMLQDDMTATRTDQSLAEKLSNNKRDSFASYKPETNKRALTVKVGIGFFVPTYGILIVREYVRRRREERYVEKGLEILEAQKAEYFNVTQTTNDSDLSEELKKLNNTDTEDDDDEDEDDDDDDDDDDSDDDDEPEPPKGRRPPRKPLGDGPSSGGGGGESGGDGRPSDEDLDKLNKIFGKS